MTRATPSNVRLEIDRSRCALCGGPNACALAEAPGGQGAKAEGPTAEGVEAEPPQPCWCVEARFPEALLEIANARDGGASCICRRCLDEHAAANA